MRETKQLCLLRESSQKCCVRGLLPRSCKLGYQGKSGLLRFSSFFLVVVVVVVFSSLITISNYSYKPLFLFSECSKKICPMEIIRKIIANLLNYSNRITVTFYCFPYFFFKISHSNFVRMNAENVAWWIAALLMYIRITLKSLIFLLCFFFTYLFHYVIHSIHISISKQSQTCFYIFFLTPKDHKNAAWINH